MATTVSSVLGRPVWYELMTTDMKAAEKFYRSGRLDVGALRGLAKPYTMFNRSGDVPSPA